MIAEIDSITVNAVDHYIIPDMTPLSEEEKIGKKRDYTEVTIFDKSTEMPTKSFTFFNKQLAYSRHHYLNGKRKVVLLYKINMKTTCNSKLFSCMVGLPLFPEDEWCKQPPFDLENYKKTTIKEPQQCSVCGNSNTERRDKSILSYTGDLISENDKHKNWYDCMILTLSNNNKLNYQTTLLCERCLEIILNNMKQKIPKSLEDSILIDLV